MNRNTKTKNTKKIKHLMISNNFRFWDKSILLQDVSLEYDISHWNKPRNKPFVFQGNIAVLQKDYKNNIDSENDNATRE